MARVSDIRYIGYAVPDIEAERNFYSQTWGLNEVRSADGISYFAAAGTDEKYVVRLRQSEMKRVDLVAWATPSRTDVDTLADAVAKAGCRMISTPGELQTFGGGYGFRFFDPNGMTVEISAGVERGPSRSLRRGEGLPIKISHVVMHSPDHKGIVKFYTDVLGFRVSDWLGDFMCFLRCNEWHHRLAFLPGPPCVNHVAYDMLGVDDVMKGIARLKRQQTELKWGPGRHTAGNNIFSYFTTPANFGIEYTSELERVDDDTWEAGVLTPEPGVMDQWGIGVGGPQAMPHPEPDHGLFQAPVV